MKINNYHLFCFFIICLLSSCANITTPNGGKKDITPPKLLQVTPKDSLLDTKTKKIELTFDEYITVSDVSTEVQISPIISIAPTVIGLNKKVIIKITDSLLEDSTTYRINLGKAVKDLHEGNIFKNYTYTFSTGNYFDSLELHGSIIDAATGLPDSASVAVELYNATGLDSDVVRHKPKYVVKVDSKGNFKFKGLPKKAFRLYALKDNNGNLVYDGIGEKIAFNDSFVTAGDSAQFILRLFAEDIDTSSKSKMDTIAKKKTDTTVLNNKEIRARQKPKDESIKYTVNIDTNDLNHRTFDITHNIDIKFNKPTIYNKEKITLLYDDNGKTTTALYIVVQDTSHKEILHVVTEWKENTVYTLKLIKGFAKDTGGADVVPSKYTFRTFEDEDYGKFHIHLSSQFFGSQYLLQVKTENDSIYLKPVIDTFVTLNRLKPAKYNFKIIFDKNGNGKWDTGDLLQKIQPEMVIPYAETVNLKAGWDNEIDFTTNSYLKNKK